MERLAKLKRGRVRAFFCRFEMLLSFRLYRKRGAAAACGGSIWVANHKLSARQIFAVINFSAAQVGDTHGVNQDRHATFFNLGVILIDLFVKSETILKS